MSGKRAAAGFTLVELVVVLVLVAAVVAIGASAMSRQLPGQRLREAARELAAQLRYTRAQAIASGKPQLFTLDARTREWRAGERRGGKLARDIQVVATGGRFLLSHGQAAWQVDIEWLTGEVRVSRARAP